MPIRLAAILLMLSVAGVWAQPRDNKPAAGFRGEFLLAFADAEKKVLVLAKAVPGDKYSWRPTAGVRSTGEVYMHIANGNRLLLMFMKGTPPRDEFEKAIETNEEREKKITEKAEIIKELESSFKQVRQALDKASEADLSRQVKFSGTDTTVRGIFHVISNHVSEHLGQSIAYARMSGVVPPWSARQGGQ
jgi:uncharacterized damage-inducible protein DinB